MRHNWQTIGLISTHQLRRCCLRYGAVVAGLAVVLQFLAWIPVVGMIPAPYFLPFLPVIVVGMLFWLADGRYRESIAVWLILAIVIFGMFRAAVLDLAVFSILTIFGVVALSSLIQIASDWLITCRYFLIGFGLSIVSIIAVSQLADKFGFVAQDRFGMVRTLENQSVIDPNHFAFHAGMALLLSISLLTMRNLPGYSNVDRLIAYLGIIVSVLVLVASQSRGALLAIMGAVGVMVVFGEAITRWRTWIGAASIGVAAISALMITRPSIVDRFLDDDGTGGGRTLMWRSALDYATGDRSILLFGAGTMQGGTAFGLNNAIHRDFPIASRFPTIDFVGQPLGTGVHNSYISWLLDYGLIGLLVAAIACSLAILRASKIDQGCQVAFGLGLIAYFALVSVSYVAYELYAVSIACGGVSLGYLYFRRDEDAPQ